MFIIMLYKKVLPQVYSLIILKAIHSWMKFTEQNFSRNTS